MQFNTSTVDNTTPSTSKFPKGVFVDLVTITSCNNADSQYNHCNLYVEGEPVKGYTKKFYLGGNHKEEQGNFVDWGTTKNGVKGGSWKVSHFIEKATGLNAKDIVLNDDGTIAQETLDKVIGSSVYILQYESTKRSRNTWFFFSSESDGRDKLLDQWARSNAPADYKHKTGEFESQWNAGVTQNKPKDDLPF